MLFISFCLLYSNPIVEHIINEFQVAPSDSERVELHYLRSASYDTISTDSFNLFNLEFHTPSGQSFIDTQTYLQRTGTLIRPQPLVHQTMTIRAA